MVNVEIHPINSISQTGNTKKSLKEIHAEKRQQARAREAAEVESRRAGVVEYNKFREEYLGTPDKPKGSPGMTPKKTKAEKRSLAAQLAVKERECFSPDTGALIRKAARATASSTTKPTTSILKDQNSKTKKKDATVTFVNKENRRSIVDAQKALTPIKENGQDSTEIKDKVKELEDRLTQLEKQQVHVVGLSAKKMKRLQGDFKTKIYFQKRHYQIGSFATSEQAKLAYNIAWNYLAPSPANLSDDETETAINEARKAAWEGVLCKYYK